MKKMLLITFMAVLFAGQAFKALAITVTTTNPTSVTTDEIVAAPAITSAVPAMEAVSDAMKEFKNLTKQERKERIKEVKKEIKQFKADKKNNAAPSTNTLLLVILALLLPPLAVYLHQGEINGKFWLSLILTLLFFIPGVIYALIVVLGNG
jgi:uncharacterized membrane protein YqaE (UPF0057 family)